MILTRILFVLLALCCWFFCDHIWTLWCSAALLVCFIGHLIARNLLFVIKYVEWGLSIALFSFAVFCCEAYSLNLYELQTESYFVGSLPLVVLYVMLACFVMERLDISIDFANHPATSLQDEVFYQKVLFIFCALSTLCWLTVLNRPSFLLGFDRFAYEQLLSPWVRKCRNILQCCVPVAILLYLISGRGICKMKIVIAIMATMPFVAFLVWIGNKSGVFLFLFLNVLSPALLFFIARNGLSKLRIRHVAMIVVAFAVFLGGVLVKQFGSYGVESAAESIFGRIAQQGQLWWAVMESGEWSHWDVLPLEIKAAVATRKTDDEFESYGVYRLMDLYAPEDLNEAYRASGFRYSAHGIEVPYYCCGLTGLIVATILYSIIHVVCVNVYLFSIAKSNFLAAVLTSKVQLIFASACAQGDWNDVFSVKMMALVVAIGIAFCWKKLMFQSLRFAPCDNVKG